MSPVSNITVKHITHCLTVLTCISVKVNFEQVLINVNGGEFFFFFFLHLHAFCYLVRQPQSSYL